MAIQGSKARMYFHLETMTSQPKLESFLKSLLGLGDPLCVLVALDDGLVAADALLPSRKQGLPEIV